MRGLNIEDRGIDLGQTRLGVRLIQHTIRTNKGQQYSNPGTRDACYY